MARRSHSVDDAIARFDELVHRYEGGARGEVLREVTQGTAAVARRLATIGVAIGALILVVIGLSLFEIGPIGLKGLFLVALAILAILVIFSLQPMHRAPKRVAYTEDLPTKTVVKQLDGLLASRRSALPAPAARRADAISAQLPLLENRLAEIDPLDPLAQDARRLMGKHLPDLLDRYERVPAAYRQERDGEGLTVDERLVKSLDAASAALDEIGGKLAQGDRDAFETQGRFIESRYWDSDTPA